MIPRHFYLLPAPAAFAAAALTAALAAEIIAQQDAARHACDDWLDLLLAEEGMDACHA